MKYDHHRIKVVSEAQHLYEHNLDEFSYSHPALPGNGSAEDAINYIFNVLYPKIKAEYATPALLPTGLDTPTVGDVAPELGDQRLVVDDGDGNYAMYMFAKWDGDAAATWHKIADFDFGENSIVQGLLDQTQYLFPRKYGTTDYDQVTELALTGDNAGQHFYGGDTSGQNLILHANNGDDPGIHTGSVFIDDDIAPLTDLDFDLGEATKRFAIGYVGTMVIGTSTMTITSNATTGLITDTNGVISFDTTNLITTGNIDGSIITASTNLVVDDTTDSITIGIGSIIDTTGAISFGVSNLSTTGTLASGVATIDSTIIIGTGSITDSTGFISFGDETLTTTGDINAATGTLDRLVVDDITIDGNTITGTGGGVATITTEPFPEANINAPTETLLFGLLNNSRLAIPFTASDTGTFTQAVSRIGIKQSGVMTVPVDGQMRAHLYTYVAGIPTALIETSPTILLPASFSADTLAGSTKKTFLFNSPVVAGVDYMVVYDYENYTFDVASNWGIVGDVYINAEVLKMGSSNNDGSTWSTNAVFRYWSEESIDVPSAGILNIDAGIGIINCLSPVTAIDTDITGVLTVVGSAVIDSVTLDGTAISVVGDILTTPQIVPDTATRDIGITGNRYRNIYLSGSILDDTGDMTMPDLMSLSRAPYRDVAKTTPAVDGDILIWNDATSKYLASTPGGTNHYIAIKTDVELGSPVVVAGLGEPMDDARNAIWQLWEITTGDLLNVPISVAATTVSINNTVPLPAGNYKLIGIEV